MQATTLQFRAIVRKELQRVGFKAGKSYTDKPVGPMHNTNTRYVAIDAPGLNRQHPDVMARINQALTDQGYSTDATKPGSFIRGVCKAA